MTWYLTDPPSWLTGLNLPGEAIAIGVEAFEQAMVGRQSMPDDEAQAVALSAINQYYEQVDGEWIVRGLVEMSLVITKAQLHPDGTMKWLAVTSDTDKDSRGESTSVQLFQDWINRVEKSVTVPYLPAPRMPFLGLSHYSDLDGLGEAGPTEKMYIDGKKFRAAGTFYSDSDHPLGKALFKAVKAEYDLIQKGETIEQPIRISAAWYDLCHSHGNFTFRRKSLFDKCPMCEKGQVVSLYLEGQLDHFAGTRVPINGRTSLELTERSMTTRKEDAESILLEEDKPLADELENKSKLVGKSETETPALVVKAKEGKEKPADKEAEEEEEEAEGKGKDKANYKKKADIEKMVNDMAYLPMGGATSMAEAMAYQETQEKISEAYSRIDLFLCVLSNITYLPADKQLSALKGAVTEMSNELMAIKAAVSDVYLTEPITPGGEIMASKYQELATKAETIVAGQGTREEKQVNLQAVLSDLAQVMKADLDQKNPAVPAVVDNNNLAEVLRAAFTPLAEQMALLNARLTPQQQQVQAGQQGIVYQVPTQRSMAVPVVIQPPAGPPVSPVTGEPSSLTSFVRRSVGLNS